MPPRERGGVQENNMLTMVVMLTLALGGAQADGQEGSRVPKDSIELTVIGCLEGRVLSTIESRQADVERGPYVGARLFRLNGKRDVMDEVKRRNKQLVEVVGIVKRSALDDKGIKSGPVSITGGSPVSGTGRIPIGADNVPVMDVTAVKLQGTSCQKP
jgi:hypothetical protein